MSPLSPMRGGHAGPRLRDRPQLNATGFWGSAASAPRAAAPRPAGGRKCQRLRPPHPRRVDAGRTRGAASAPHAPPRGRVSSRLLEVSDRPRSPEPGARIPASGAPTPASGAPPGAEQEEAPSRPAPPAGARGGAARRGGGPAEEAEGRWTGGWGPLSCPLTTRPLPAHLRRAAAGGAMDLAGLLLDEEGTFSLTGFQDFSVSALPAASPASRPWSPD